MVRWFSRARGAVVGDVRCWRCYGCCLLTRGLGRARAATGINAKFVGHSGEDPQFATKFYKRSRLHFLSTWKAHIREHIVTIRADAHAAGIKHDPAPVDHPDRVIFHAGEH